MKQLVWLVLTIVATSTACHGKTNKYGTGWNPCALDQQWTEATSQHYWWTSQGSQVAPYDYFTALEVKDSQELFASSSHFDRLRYVTVPAKSERNPGGLAIGFVKNEAKVDGLDGWFHLRRVPHREVEDQRDRCDRGRRTDQG